METASPYFSTFTTPSNESAPALELLAPSRPQEPETEGQRAGASEEEEQARVVFAAGIACSAI